MERIFLKKELNKKKLFSQYFIKKKNSLKKFIKKKSK